MNLFGASVEKLKRKQDVKGLAKLLDDEDWSTCKEASQALADLDDPAGADALLDALGGERERARRAALWNAHRLDERAVEPLVALLSAVDEPFLEIDPEGEWTVAISAASALCELGDPRGLDSLLAATKDPDLPSRGAAISALAMASDSQALEFLRAVLAGEEEIAVKPAVVMFYVGRMGDKASWAVTPLIEIVQRGEVVDAQMAIMALANIGDERAIPVFVEALSHPSEGVRESAGDVHDWEKLLGLTGVSDEELRRSFGVRRKVVATGVSLKVKVVYALESEGLAQGEAWV